MNHWDRKKPQDSAGIISNHSEPYGSLRILGISRDPRCRKESLGSIGIRGMARTHKEPLGSLKIAEGPRTRQGSFRIFVSLRIAKDRQESIGINRNCLAS